MASPQPPAEILFRSTVEEACAERALVLEAAGIPCKVQSDRREYILAVAGRDAARARAELEAYARENPDAPRRDSDARAQSSGWAGALSYAIVILLVAICDDRNVLGLDWFGAGKTSAGLIRHGEWWRTITALTLHANAGHLLANLVMGGLFGLFAAQLLGSGLAWFSILIGGAAGNAMNAWIRPADHTSVGASTAVFAALGLVSAWAWARRRSDRRFSVARWTPLIGGVLLLGYLGLGGGRTDVPAHLAGFVCGAVLGAAWSRFGLPGRLRARGQALLAGSALALLVAAWAPALSKAHGP